MGQPKLLRNGLACPQPTEAACFGGLSFLSPHHHKRPTKRREGYVLKELMARGLGEHPAARKNTYGQIVVDVV